jgi:2'-5' RNA ligase
MGLLDEESNQKFESFKDKLREAGFEPDDFPAHITLGIYVELEKEKMLAWIDEFSRTHQVLNVRYNHIGVFDTTVCFAAPRVDKALLTFHEEFHARYDADCGDTGCNFSLQLHNWVPHTTIAVGNADKIAKMLPDVCRYFEPINARMTSIQLCEFYPVQEVGRFSLQ